MTPFRRDLSVVGTMADLPRICEFIEEACDHAAISPTARFDVLLAVDEACCNVFEHAYAGAIGELKLRFETYGTDLIITVRDHGRAFDPAAVPLAEIHQPLESRPIGGLGLYLIRQLMDKVAFEFSPDQGNTLVMEKRGVVSRRQTPQTPQKSRRRL